MRSPLKPALLIVAAFTIFAGCSTAENTSSSTNSKWIVLFDGKSTDALRGYKRDSFPDKLWNIDNGALHTIPGSERVDLISKEKFKDFELELEWKVPAGGNSGVFYGVQETDGPAYSTGPEMQVLDDDKHPDGKNPKTSAGALYAMIAPNESKALKPVGEFNKARVVAKGGHIEHWLNGKKIVDYQWGSPEIKALISSSKFNKMPRFMENLEGHVALQHHGQEVWFRNVRIRRL
jgi:hypothetical protein